MITPDEHIDVSLIPSDYSISFPFDVILYITGYTGIGVLIGAVLAPPYWVNKKNKRYNENLYFYLQRNGNGSIIFNRLFRHVIGVRHWIRILFKR